MQQIGDSRFSKSKSVSQGPLKTLVIEEPSSTRHSEEKDQVFITQKIQPDLVTTETDSVGRRPETLFLSSPTDRSQPATGSVG